MKKKIKADSVDELFEIVKAVQNGEEPEAYAKRKAEEQKRRAEEAKRKALEEQMAEEQAAEERAAARIERVKGFFQHQRTEDSFLLRDEEEENENDEEFERLLEDEPDDGLKEAAGQLSVRLKEAGSFVKERAKDLSREVRGRRETRLNQKKQEAEKKLSEEKEMPPETKAPEGKAALPETKAPEEKEMPPETKTQEEKETLSETEVSEEPEFHMEPVASPRRERLADTEKAGRKTRRRYGAKSVSEDAETVGRRILRSLHMEPAGENRTQKQADDDSTEGQTADNTGGIQDSDEIDENSIDLDTVQILDQLLNVSDMGQGDQSSNADHDDAAAGKNGQSASKGAAERLSDYKTTPHGPDIKAHIRQLCSRLSEKGFDRRKLAMLGGGIAAVVLIFAIALYAANYIIQIHENQKYITADSGLTVTVKKQPEEWCNSCELQLEFSVQSGSISSIDINGTLYEPDNSGTVTVQPEDYLLEASVTTDEGTVFTAEIEIPMLDAEAPVLSVEKSGNEITLTAVDARSSVDAVWYAVLDESDWLDVPQYQQYAEPITYEEGRTYYFYASDRAGNHSSPVITTMETAESLTLSESELALFPGETAYLTAEVNPSGALLNNVTYESSNTNVVTVTRNGFVTAIAEGSALIKASADGVETVSCMVTVSSERTVTISTIGDCTLGTYLDADTTASFDAYYSMYGASWFFENVRDILEDDDITFANLEGTLTDETTPEDKTYVFKGEPSYTEILQDGSIEVVTLANNHSSDYGAQSLTDTEENLTEAGIDYCIGDTIAYTEVSGIKVAFIGIYELNAGMDCETQVRETIAEAQSEDAQLIIVAFHWGTEKETAADEIQQSLAHTAIDCGADLVVGHHPHVLQGIEKYNGKYIVYSLANFCFGGNTNPADQDTMIFRQTFTITQDGVADDDAIEIIPCTVSSETGYNDYRPTPATGSDADDIMARINEYSAAFGDIVYTAATIS